LGRRPRQPALPGKVVSRKRMWLFGATKRQASALRFVEGFLLTHSEIPTDKIKAYRDTQYRVAWDGDPFTLMIDTRSEALSRLYATTGQPCGVFITAFNPFGQAQSDEANEAAHGRLGEYLRALTPHVIEGSGVDPTGAWPEEKSFLALGINPVTARLLGSRVRQDAVVWVGEDAVTQLIPLR
jgi:hypothetical protein